MFAEGRVLGSEQRNKIAPVACATVVECCRASKEDSIIKTEQCVD